MSKALQPIVYSVVRKLCKEREDNHKFPHLATEREIASAVVMEVSACLDELEADGIVIKSTNINGMRMYQPSIMLNKAT